MQWFIRVKSNAESKYIVIKDATKWFGMVCKPYSPISMRRATFDAKYPYEQEGICIVPNGLPCPIGKLATDTAYEGLTKPLLTKYCTMLKVVETPKILQKSVAGLVEVFARWHKPDYSEQLC